MWAISTELHHTTLADQFMFCRIWFHVTNTSPFINSAMVLFHILQNLLEYQYTKTRSIRYLHLSFHTRKIAIKCRFIYIEREKLRARKSKKKDLESQVLF